MTTQSERLHNSPLLHARDVSHLYPRSLTIENSPRPAASISSEQASCQATYGYPLSCSSTNTSAILSSLSENFRLTCPSGFIVRDISLIDPAPISNLTTEFAGISNGDLG